MSMSVLTGNIGCGKSFLASRFAKMGQVVFNMDRFTAMTGGGEYGLYDSKKKDIYHLAEETTITSALMAGFSVVIDRTNMDIKRRKRFMDIGKEHAKEIVSYDWGTGNEQCLNRRLKNPNGIPVSVWANVFELMKKSYERPSLSEGFSKIIEMPPNYKFYAFDFDGTIVENGFPEIGEIISGQVEHLNKLWEEISNVIIIWSCRSGDYENEMRAFLLKNKIPFDFINENPLFETGSRKIFAHKYFDDRNENL